MFISLTDNGGRRVSGDRRLFNQKGVRDEKRSCADRRASFIERRARKEADGTRYERRAMPIFMKAQQ